jgi:poly-gamma-glutamate capsule biosynthesis protein CapA/YwtB (metallophosphatase superfamily)
VRGHFFLSIALLLGCTAEAREEPAPLGGSSAEVPVAAAASTDLPAPRSAPEQAAVAATVDPVLTISAVGDCTLGDPAGSERAPGSFHKMFEDTGRDLARPFSGVQAVLGADDLTIANLEGTLTTAGCRSDVAFAFRGDKAFARMLTLGSVDVVSLANNHSADCGQTGVRETREALKAEGRGYFGLGDVDTRVIKDIEVHNLGYLGGRRSFGDPMKKDVRRLKRPDNLVIVSFHWGIEGIHDATDVQQGLARDAIDAGADLVLGHHPHVLQGIEEYRGKKIVYSLGNFVFGGNAQPKKLDSMIFQARFTKQEGVITPVGYEIVPVRFSGQAAQNDFRPVLLSGDDAERVRADVDRYSRALAPPKLKN